MKIIYIILFVFTFVLLAFIKGCVKSISYEVKKDISNNKKIEYQKELDMEINKLLISMAKQMQQQLPIKIDEYTELESVIALNKTLTYKNKLLLDINSIENKTKFVQDFKAEQKNNLCNHKDIIVMLKQGVQFKYIYFDMNRKFVTEHDFDKASCGIN